MYFRTLLSICVIFTLAYGLGELHSAIFDHHLTEPVRKLSLAKFMFSMVAVTIILTIYHTFENFQKMKELTKDQQNGFTDK